MDQANGSAVTNSDESFKVVILQTRRLDCDEFEELEVDPNGNISRDLTPSSILHMAVMGTSNVYSFTTTGRLEVKRNIANISDLSYGRKVASHRAADRMKCLVKSLWAHSSQKVIYTKLFFTSVPILHHETEPGCYDVDKKSSMNVLVASDNSAKVSCVRVVPRKLGGFSLEQKTLGTLPILYPSGHNPETGQFIEVILRQSLQKFASQ